MEIDSISQWILNQFPGSNLIRDKREAFLFFFETQGRRLHFALLSQADVASGIRLSAGIGEELFNSLFSPTVAAHGTVEDLAARGRIAPHPSYRHLHWVELTDLEEAELPAVRELLSAAWQIVAVVPPAEPDAESESRAVAEARFAGKVHQPDLNTDIFHLPVLLPPANARVTEFQKGLPHPFFDSGGYLFDLWLSDNIGIHDYRFYRKPVALDRKFAAAILKIFSNPDAYGVYRGPKRCGGYHADFALRVDSSSGCLWILVCLGCDEVLLFGENTALHCDLDPQMADVLKAYWFELLDQIDPLPGNSRLESLLKWRRPVKQ